MTLIRVIRVRKKRRKRRSMRRMRRRWSSWPEEDEPWWRLEGEVLLELDSQGPSFVGTTPGHDHVDGGGDNVDQWILRLHIVLFSLYVFLFCPLWNLGLFAFWGHSPSSIGIYWNPQYKGFTNCGRKYRSLPQLLTQVCLHGGLILFWASPHSK